MATLHTLPEATTLLPPGAAAGRTTLAARSFLYAVFKHRRLVVAVFLLVSLASAVAALTRPRSWRATSKVLVKLGETVQLAPAEAPSRSIYLPLSQEVVKTEAEIVKSGEVVTEAIARVGVQPEPGVDMNEMIASMQLALTVMPVAGSNVLQISYLGRNPERAARMVNAITDVYLEHHNRVYRTEGVHEFYTDQLRVLETETRVTQRRLRDYMETHNVVDADQEITILQRDILEQEKGVRHHRAKIRGNQRRRNAVQAQLERTPAEISYSEEYHANPTLRAFTDKLTELELERNKLLAIYLPNDRHVEDVNDQIAKLRARMKGEDGRVLSSTMVRQNELYAELERNLVTLNVHSADLLGREPGLVSRLKATRRRLHKLSALRFRIATLRQDYDDKTAALELYRKKREEARITEAMKNQAMVNVSVMERATAPLEPVSGVLLPLIVGLMGGLGLASAMAVAVEYVNRRLRFEEEVERYLELPVLAVIPDLETTSGIARA